jgi:hypothetical protein
MQPMFEPTAKGVHVSRDITWLRRGYFPLPSLEAGEDVVMSLDPDDAIRENRDELDTANLGMDDDYQITLTKDDYQITLTKAERQNKVIIKIRLRWHERASRADDRTWLTNERGD